MNESVSYLIKASCSDCLDLVICLELVETAPRMMSLTPRGKGMGWASLYHVFSKSLSGLVKIREQGEV